MYGYTECNNIMKIFQGCTLDKFEPLCTIQKASIYGLGVGRGVGDLGNS